MFGITKGVYLFVEGRGLKVPCRGQSRAEGNKFFPVLGMTSFEQCTITVYCKAQSMTQPDVIPGLID